MPNSRPSLKEMCHEVSIVITTLPLSRIDDFLECLATWTQHYQLYVLLSTAEANEYPLELDKLNGLNIQPLVHDFDVSPSGGRGCFSKRTPSLALLWEVLELTLANDQAAVYINADIELPKGEHKKLNKIVEYCQTNKQIAFLRRWDYFGESRSLSTPYLAGFDLFVLPKTLLSHCDRKSLQNFFLGQVGWDYALPLLFAFQTVLTSFSVHITHKIHPTSSTAPWEDAMILVCQNIHSSHFRRLGIFRVLVPRILSYLGSAYKMSLQRTLNQDSPFISGIKYIYARILFYFLIKRVLLNLREF